LKKISKLQLNLFVIFGSLTFFVFIFLGFWVYQERFRIFNYLFPPKPEIILTECTGLDDPWSDLGTNVKITVRNNGGAGKIRVYTNVTQNGYTYRKNFEVEIGNFETRDFAIPFDEVFLFTGNASCHSEVKVLY
jgi:hypothetical protein